MFHLLVRQQLLFTVLGEEWISATLLWFLLTDQPFYAAQAQGEL
jgi:hypothetical protein